MKRTLLAIATAASLAAVIAPQPGQARDGLTADRSASSGGPVWSAAIQHRTSGDDDQGRLVMVRPEGGVVPIGEVSDDARILDVSADRRYVMTARSQEDQVRVTVWDTTTRRPSYFRVPGSWARPVLHRPRDPAAGPEQGKDGDRARV
jgi:hypothetical protein